MKQRFSSLDVKVIAHELSAALCSLRLANVYDLSSRIFLLKFAKPNHRQQLVVDSGFRCHLSNFARSTATEPSAFVARLRKFLKTRRVTAVSQIGTDRVIEIQFSDGQYRLILEFYAGGNIILTDKDLKVISLLRIVNTGEAEDELRVGFTYPLEGRQNYAGVPELTKDRVRNGLTSALEKDAANTAAGKKQKRKAGSLLRRAVASSLPEFPPMLIDHALKIRGFDPTTAIQDILDKEELLDGLMGVLQKAQEVDREITESPVAKGYIVAKPMKKSKPVGKDQDDTEEEDKENESLMYEDFHPFRPKQFEDDSEARILEYDGFNATVDEFFSSIESQKLESRLTEREEAAKRKLNQAKDEHARRLGGLQQVQETNVLKAQAIESNLQRVDEAAAAVNGLIAQGMDWVEIERLVEMEQARNNPVAQMIKLPLKLNENTITILLAEETFDEDEEEEFADVTDSEASDSEDESSTEKTKLPVKQEDKRLSVDIDLALSSWSNARQYYDQKKTAASKEQKTIQASQIALKSSEQKIQADLKKGLSQEKQTLRPVRKQLWFEKFYYFISSEGYLVVGGRDSQQSEILYKKYLDKGDIWIHSDISGSACLVVKNRPGYSQSPIPISTLSQAGTFCVATSTAWDSKAVMAAWWVESEQVSKMDHTGDFLGLGMFHIKGKKNFLPPAQLLLGFGIMFRVSEESKKKHTKNRVIDDRAQADDVTSSQADTTAPPESEPEDETDHDDEEQVESKEQDDRESQQEHNDSDDDQEPDDQDEKPRYSNPLQSSQGQEERRPLGDLTIREKDSQAGEPDDSVSEDEDDEGEKGSKEDSASQDQSESLTGASTPAISTDTPDTVPTSDPKPKQVSQVRGKRGKKSKIKSKYAEQDEEDRVLAMQLLGSTSGQQKAKIEADNKARKEADSQAQKERRRQQHQAAQATGKEAEEERRKKLDKGLPLMDKEDTDELLLVDNFVGRPLPGDEILDALVVCAPWDAVGAKLMWRFKIQPGAQKKGKAVKEILAAWTRLIGDRDKKKLPGKDAPGYEAEVTMRKQAEFVKGVRDVEVIGCVPVGKVRVEVKGGGGGDKGKGGKGKGAKGGRRGGKGSKKK